MQIKFAPTAERSFIVKPAYDTRGFILCIDIESCVRAIKHYFLPTPTKYPVFTPVKNGFYIPISHKETLLYAEIAKVNPYLPDSAIFQAYEATINFKHTFFEGDIVVNRYTGKTSVIQWYEALNPQHMLRLWYFKP